VTEKNQNLVTRVLTSLVAIPIVFYTVYLGSWPLSLLFGMAAALCALEYYGITMKGWSPAAWVGVAVTFTMPFMPLLGPPGGHAAFFTLVAFAMFAWSYHLIRGPLKEGPVLVAYLVTGMLYGASGLTALVALRTMENGFQWLICVLVLTWTNDTFAYFAGRTLGKHKLYEEVSPNKTWEGFFGGMAGGTVCLLAYRTAFFHQLSFLDVALLGIAGGIMGPVGDLSESMLKRAYGVKDSGKIVPGHGGMLDRIDALLFNAPLVFLYVYFVRS